MPELPEVQTTVNGIKKTVVGLKITDVWTDLALKNQKNKQFMETIKNSLFFNKFKKEISGQKIIGAERRAKNILIHLSNKKTILIHMKMTGHMMIGKYEYDKKKNAWIVHVTEKNEALHDPYNRFIHVVFTLSNNKHLVLCDSRKFAKVTFFETTEIQKHFQNFGPEPLDITFTEKEFTNVLLKKPNGKIKTVLLDQTIISGIGNIYSDEMLWLAGVHPERRINNITDKEFQLLHKGMLVILKKGIDFGGDSTSDYRNIEGKKGKFHATHNVYRETKKPCKKKGCRGIIQRKIIGARSAHFCPIHQK